MTSQATKRQSINPGATRAMYDALHFSQATRVGNVIWVSGQVGIDAAMKPAKGMEAQAHLAFQGLRSVLEAAGASPEPATARRRHCARGDRDTFTRRQSSV